MSAEARLVRLGSDPFRLPGRIGAGNANIVLDKGENERASCSARWVRLPWPSCRNKFLLPICFGNPSRSRFPETQT